MTTHTRKSKLVKPSFISCRPFTPIYSYITLTSLSYRIEKSNINPQGMLYFLAIRSDVMCYGWQKNEVSEERNRMKQRDPRKGQRDKRLYQTDPFFSHSVCSSISQTRKSDDWKKNSNLTFPSVRPPRKNPSDWRWWDIDRSCLMLRKYFATIFDRKYIQ